MRWLGRRTGGVYLMRIVAAVPGSPRTKSQAALSAPRLSPAAQEQAGAPYLLPKSEVERGVTPDPSS